MCWNGSKSRRSRGPFFCPPKKNTEELGTKHSRWKEQKELFTFHLVHLSDLSDLTKELFFSWQFFCDLFGMVKWPFEMVKWLPTRGWNGHFESPGFRYCWWTKSEPPLWMFLKFCWSYDGFSLLHLHVYLLQDFFSSNVDSGPRHQFEGGAPNSTYRDEKNHRHPFIRPLLVPHNSIYTDKFWSTPLCMNNFLFPALGFSRSNLWSRKSTVPTLQ